MKKYLLLLFLTLLLTGCSLSNKNKLTKNKEENSSTSVVVDNNLNNFRASATTTRSEEDEFVPDPNLTQEWIDLLKNLNVPAKYSDLCGYMSHKCQGFSFINGELPEKFQFDNNIGKDGDHNNADIMLNVGGAKVGIFIVNNKKIDIAVVRYGWSWGSSGGGYYVVKKTNAIAQVFSRIDNGKGSSDFLILPNNKIKFTVDADVNPWGSNKTCYFKDNKLNEEFLQCDYD